MQTNIKYYASIDPANVMALETIEVYSQENGLIEQFQKLKTNVNYDVCFSNVFTFYDNVKSQEITKLGIEYINKIYQNINN
jgi:hypothetical protein